MNPLEFSRRLVHLFRRGRYTGDLRDEMRLHIELRARKLQSQGIPQWQAIYAARRQFGNAAWYQDQSSEVWGWTMWERLYQDLRQGVRTLRKSPGFTAVAVFTLALGLGINTAVFSVVNTVMVHSLPYAQPEKLISLWEESAATTPRTLNSSGPSFGSSGSAQRTTVSVANLVDYRQRGHSFAGLASFALTPMNLTGNGNPDRIPGESVSAGFFDVLGAAPAQGRAFLPEDDTPDANRVAIVTNDFWQRRLGGDTGVLQRSIQLDGQTYQIVGVLPPGFQSPAQLTQRDLIEFYVPAAYSKQLLMSHGDHEVNVVARLKPDVSAASAQAELDAISAGLAKQYPNSNLGLRAVIAPLQDDLVRKVRTSLLALLGASGLIVLITCVNVANLLLVRAVGRRHESSVRLALGASRFRMIRQFMVESLLIAAAGCVAGVLLGRIMMRVLVTLAPPTIPLIHAVQMDWRVFAVATALATLVGIAFGMAPAWQASQTKPAEALKATAKGAGGRSQVRWRSALTVSEVALSLILLVSAGLLLKSFVTLMGIDLGFRPERVLAMNINLPDVRYPKPLQRLQFFQQLEERVSALPGVQAVTYANRMPMRGGWGSGVSLDTAPDRGFDSDFQAVSPGYFRTLGLSLAQGRLLTPYDREGALPAAVVNQAFVREHLRGQDPIGRRFKRGGPAPWVSIVGVVTDIRRGGKEGEIKPEVYLPAAQTGLYPVRLADLAVRTTGDPRQFVNAIQRQVLAIDKDQPITNVRTMGEIIDASVAQRRFQTLLLMVFAGVALGLAIVGIYGVLAYSVSQRTPEIGIRIALGAAPGNILALVLRQAGALIGAGIALGLAGALALTRYEETLLFQVHSNDWRTYAGAAALLSMVAIAAALVPARRGSRVQPVVALRNE